MIFFPPLSLFSSLSLTLSPSPSTHCSDYSLKTRKKRGEGSTALPNEQGVFRSFARCCHR